MYQALRSLGVDSQLVIYPNQFHGISIPATRRIGSSGISRGTTSTLSQRRRRRLRDAGSASWRLGLTLAPFASRRHWRRSHPRRPRPDRWADRSRRSPARSRSPDSVDWWADHPRQLQDVSRRDRVSMPSCRLLSQRCWCRSWRVLRGRLVSMALWSFATRPCPWVTYNSPDMTGTDIGHHQARCSCGQAYGQHHSTHRSIGIPDSCHAADAPDTKRKRKASTRSIASGPFSEA